ncbi:MAG: hypothetical protein RL654_2279 [Pseudomonadota bacterium]|jgi:hypothetical protein
MNHPPRRSTSADRPPLQSKRLLDQLRERIRYLHYSLKTEEAYLFWSRAYIRFHGVRHPKDMSAVGTAGGLSLNHRPTPSSASPTYRRTFGASAPR